MSTQAVQIIDKDAPIFTISVAASLSGMHPQTLRTYDRLGLVSPGRAGGGARRYSLRDIETLREIAALTAEGIGLEGVRRILGLEDQVAILRDRVRDLEEQLALAEHALRRTITERTARNLPAVPEPPGQAVVVWRRHWR